MRMKPSVIGLDIGGANLKAARSNGEARLRPFELWKHPERLSHQLRELLGDWQAERLAVTMTGELCDCFETKRDGVRHILAAVERAFPESSVGVWTFGWFAGVEEALDDTLAVSATNWHALATWCGATLTPSRSAILVDVGSTTTDIIPIYYGQPHSVGRTDAERLGTKELIYTGVRRTPICALIQEGVAAELFATTLDAYLMLGNVPENEADVGTADGRPATRKYSHARLARMLGGDPKLSSIEETTLLARMAVSAQGRLLTESLARMVASLPDRRVESLVIAGSGEFLARAAWSVFENTHESGDAPAPVPIISLAEQLGPVTSAAACAYAVAVLGAGEWRW